MFKVLLLLGIAFFTSQAVSQPIDQKWLGHWQSEYYELIVTPKNVVDKGKICRWVAKAPQANHTGCVSFYGGEISKADMLEQLQGMKKEVLTSDFYSDPKAKAEANKNLATLETTLNQLSGETFKVLASSDADHEVQGDCGGFFYFIDNNARAHVVHRCESAGIDSALTVTPLNKGPVTGPITQLNGEWTSTKWKYGYKLQDGLGTATATNSPRFKVGDEIIILRAVGKNKFEGEQVYQDGKFHPVTATLQPDGRLLFKGEKNISWTMDRK